MGTLITRSRPKPAVVVEPVVRRLRTTTNNAATRQAKEKLARERIDGVLKLLAEAEEEIDIATAKKDAAYEKIEEIMREAKINEHANAQYIAEISEHFIRQSRTIDPKKFKANVSSEDFWKACQIPIGVAETLLTEKELAPIIDVVPAKSTGYVLKIKPRPKKVKR